nr:immunoglobulin heavy chain junction region [Mus musculus]
CVRQGAIYYGNYDAMDFW